MDNVMMNVDDKPKPVENGKMLVETHKSCEAHVFKKARFPWQIKGQLTAENNCAKGETSCFKAECASDDVNDNFSFENHMKNKLDTQNDSLLKSSDDHKCILRQSKEENFGTDAKANMSEIDSKYLDTSMSDLQSSKRKCSSDNSETDFSGSKRVKSFEGQTANENASSERVHGLQTGSAAAANNPDFSRAISSILPNFQGLDIPSFIWQKQEMGCAIVDNVFNRTLEEMGLSPDPVVNLNASTRLTLENRSIETAIRNQGLRTSTSQGEERRILSSMEEIQHNATVQDFEHTQNQISMMMNVAQSSQSHSSVSIDLDEVKTENRAMNCQISDQDSCDADHNKYELAQHSAVMNGLDLSKVVIPTTSGIHGNSGNICENEDAFKVKGEEEDIQLTDSENFECIHMEESDSTTQCRTTADKHSETVLDLAVSTAILNQGLTFESV